LCPSDPQVAVILGRGGCRFARLCKASVAPERLENAGLNGIVFSTHVIVTALYVSQLRGCRNLRDICHTLYRIARQQGSDVSFMNERVAVNDTASLYWCAFTSLVGDALVLARVHSQASDPLSSRFWPR